MCQNCCQDSHMRSRECAPGEYKNGDYSCLLNCLAIPQLSTVSMMPENPAPNFVYLRRKEKEQVNPANCSSEEVHTITKNPLMPSIAANKEPTVLTSESIKGASFSKEPGDKNIVYQRKKLKSRYATVISSEVPCLSVVSSDSPSDAVKELHVASQRFHTHSDPYVPFKVCERGKLVSKSESIKESLVVEEQDPNEASKSTRQKIIEVDSINDSCSSSKSDTELLASMHNTEVDDSVGCSSSSVIAMEEGISEKDLCISIIRSQGVLDRISPNRNHTVNGVGDSSESSSFRLCKICFNRESVLKMLICDNCEEAFHLYCCNPRIKRIPLDEWFCHSCSKKRCKILRETISEKGRCGSSFKEEANPIVLMLRDSEPYKSGVRCGKGFQAEVPKWSGPITTDMDTIPEPLEMDSSNFVSFTELNLKKRIKLSSIGNWLQCRGVVDDGTGESADGTICGKWRRAPLFEVQTDEWDCFSSFLWDPVHADCAVPQELGTVEVLKQLKYIQMLRPRLEAKRQEAKRQRLEHRKYHNYSDLTQGLRQQQKKRNEGKIQVYRRYTHGRNKDRQN